MKTYYIYHVPGVKIGCTDNIKRRMQQQGYTEWEILEEHIDGWLAGDREIELQKEYGYKVDTTHYMLVTKNKWNENTMHILTPEEKRKGDIKRRKISKKIANIIRNRYSCEKITMKQLATQYECSKAYIHRIIHNTSI